MKNFFLIFIAHCFLPVAYSQSYFQQQVNYKIDVTLNDADNSLDGFIKIDYTNNSPDTLDYIWFHLWPNAYKNDKTAFSDQLLENGRTDFYFSDNEKRGYINRLDFKVNGLTSETEDHPNYIDVIKLLLPLHLIPGQTINISTPFHVKLPFNFSRGGHVGQSYQITQWYPKPAVYDRHGWHPMPYLDQGEFYGEFGNFDVQITLPKNYVVAATGDLQNEEELNWLKGKSKEEFKASLKKNINTNKSGTQKKSLPKSKINSNKKIPPKKKQAISEQQLNVSNKSKPETKTLHYSQDSVHDFAWFADKNFLVRTDTLQLSSGRIINAWSFFLPDGYSTWKNSIQFIKDAIITRSQWLGEYPYNAVTALEAKMGFSGGMEYPTITSISPVASEKDLDLTIEHEVGHNWNYGILASNERQHPWMDEGMNTYFDNRYLDIKYPDTSLNNHIKTGFLKSRFPQNELDWVYKNLLNSKKDQPIETSSEKFSELNYNLIAYYKTGKWMKLLEEYVGKEMFDSCLHEYYNQWKFKHPYPKDFKKIVEDVSKRNADSIFNLLNEKGSIGPLPKKNVKLYPFFTFNNTEKYNYIFISPAIGYNKYDGFMIGGLFHNYTLPSNKFQFLAAPLYATESKKLNGIARIGYNWHSYSAVQRGEISLSGESFNSDSYTDSTGKINYLNFNKIVPSVKFVFREKNPRSTITKWIQWKTFLINETGLLFTRDTIRQIDVITYPKTSSYINQLKFVIEDNRALYPYSAELQTEQGKGFARTALTANYFFNYSKGGGLSVRLFAGKFFYLGEKTFLKQFETDRYHLNMTGPKGYEDYTYSNYFVGRNEFEGAASQQIMIRDGAFKVRTDLLASKIGKTDDWLAAMNFKTDVPKNFNPLQVLPFKIPLKLFLDVGTYAEAWDRNSVTGKFIYDAGLQVSLIKDLINIYIPVLYSKVYRDYFKSTIPEKRFWKNISFSFDIQNINLKKFSRNFPL